MKYSWSLRSAVVFSARSAQERTQGGVKICHEGPCIKKTYSLVWEATAITRMHSNILEACRNQCYFLVPFRSQIFDAFWRLYGLSHLAYFNAIFMYFYKCMQQGALSAFVLCNVHVCL